MKLDVLDELPEIQICTGYRYKGKIYKEFPMDFQAVTEAKPIYEKHPGWMSSTKGIREYRKLPPNAKKYIKRLEELLKVGVKYISMGPKRDQIIVR